MNSNTPKNFVIQLGALITLYIVVTSLIILVFNITNLKFPDAIAYSWEDIGARESIRMGIALLVVFFPTFIILTRISNQTRRKEYHGAYTVFAKWLVYLSLLVAGGVLLGDLVALIIYFLNGEITTRFLVKVAALILIVGLPFYYYILDVRGYFTKNIDKSLYFGAGATLVVIAALVFGYSYIETPAEVREMRFDEQQVVDLQNIYWQVDQYYQVNDSLPATLEALYDGGAIPQPPEGRSPYTYKLINEKAFELCATFAAPSVNGDNQRSIAPLLEKNFQWEHSKGEECFVRTVDTAAKPVL